MYDTIDGILDYLLRVEGELEYALQAIESSESVTIPRLKAYGLIVKTRDYPLMEVAPESISPQYRYDEGPMDHEAWDIDSVWLQVADMGSDDELMLKTLMYYRDAIKRVVHDDNTFGNRFGRVRLGQAQFWPAFQAREQGKLLAVMRQNLQVRHLQH